MDIYVRTIMCRRIYINVLETDTIKIVKEKIYDRERYPIDGQRIIFAGKVRKDDETIKYLCEQNPTVSIKDQMHMLMRPDEKK